MSTEKTSLENERQPSCLGAVSSSAEFRTWDDTYLEYWLGSSILQKAVICF